MLVKHRKETSDSFRFEVDLLPAKQRQARQFRRRRVLTTELVLTNALATVINRTLN